MSLRRELTVTVDITWPLWGDTLEEIAEGMRAEYLHPGALVFDAISEPPSERFIATLTEHHDNGTVRTTTLWSTEAGDKPPVPADRIPGGQE